MPPQSPVAPSPTVNISLPLVVNSILAGQVDRYRLQASKGQQLVVVVTARELMPYLADAVPGWLLQAAVTLYDEQGKELAYAGGYRFHPDPVLNYEKFPRRPLPRRNPQRDLPRPRFGLYRMALGKLPFVTGVFPFGRPGRAADPRRTPGLEPPQPRLHRGRPRQAAGRLSAGPTKGWTLPRPTDDCCLAPRTSLPAKSR